MDIDGSVEREAIAALFEVAKNDEGMGWGPMPTLEMRMEATQGLASYLPRREALEALRYLMTNGRPDSIRMAATQGLAKAR
ncbi:MAG: hypothetical protein ABJA98_27585 [Acidobacteriota bacterium]